MQIALFAVLAIVVYVVSDRIVRTIDKNRDEPIQNRSLIFFIIFFALIIIGFEAMKLVLPVG
jgi:Kef-type K+ transport system membrane component KefB